MQALTMKILICSSFVALILFGFSQAQYGGYLYPAVNFIYQCPSGFARHNGVCIPIQFIQAKPGQPCHSMTECTGGAVCVGGICRCLPGLFPSQGVCILPPAYMYG